MTLDDFISKFPDAKKAGREYKVRCPAHKDKTPSLSVGNGKNGIILKCHAGCTVPEICAALGIAVKDLFFNAPKKDFTVKYKAQEKLEEDEDLDLEAFDEAYSYVDPLGNEVYQALRYNPKKPGGKKTFRQRRPDGRGGWRYSVEGVERVLYNLPSVLMAKEVWVVEGEKDANNLIKQGFCATTNVGGACKWLDPYSDSLKDKDVIICGDNDEPGQKHVMQVFESVSTKAKTVKILKLAENIKDVSLFIESSNGNSKELLVEMVENCVPHYGGVKLPLYSLADIEPSYRRLVKENSNLRFDLGTWLPSLRAVRTLFPGDFVLFVADTAVGKTAILQNIAYHARKTLRCVLFELELPKEVLFERFVSMRTKMKGSDVEKAYQSTDEVMGREVLENVFSNISICPENRLTPDRLEQIIVRSELKFGDKAQVALVDYVQLMKGKGSTRYEKASDVAESLKEIAKITNTIVIACSQVSRPEKSDAVYIPSLHSAKDTGSFESSAGVVIGAWRDKDDTRCMWHKVLKSTKGGAGTQYPCNFDGEIMLITERAQTNGEQ